jgi:hypothetical protein
MQLVNFISFPEIKRERKRFLSTDKNKEVRNITLRHIFRMSVMMVETGCNWLRAVSEDAVVPSVLLAEGLVVSDKAP